MKKILTPLLCGILLCAGCSKTVHGDDGPAGLSEFVLYKLQKAATRDQQKQIYNQLSPQEKWELWNLHFSLWKSSESVKNNPARLEMVRDLQGKLDVAVFDPGSSSSKIFLNYGLKEWMARAKKLFTDLEIFDLLQENRALMNGRMDDTKTCFCHNGSYGYGCKKVTLDLTSGLVIELGVCVDSNCAGSSSGCGSLWLESCSGSYCNFS